MKTKLKKNLPTILFFFLIIFYFEYSVTILWDSAHYMNYVNIIEGITPSNTWDVVRGPVFPIIIFLGNTLFGKTAQGLTMNTFIYYLIMLLFVYKILDYVLNNLKIDTKKKRLIKTIVLLTTIINPIIFGFYHSLLTEFVAITISTISCYLAVLWYDTDYEKEKKKYIYISIIFAFLTVFTWFLKQPYVSCGFFPLLVSYIITLFQKKKFKIFLIRTSTIILCLITLVVSIKLWNVVLIKMGNDPSTSRNPTVSLGTTLINGLGFAKINTNEETKNTDYINESKLSNKEKKEVLNLLQDNKNYIIIDIYKNNKITQSDYIEVKDNNLSTVDSMTYIIKYFFKSPLIIIDSYITNYLSIIDIYSTTTNDSIEYKSDKKVNLKFINEIGGIAYKPYHYGSSNIFYMLPDMESRVDCYKQTNNTFKPLNYMMLILGKVFLMIFKLLFVILPITLTLAIIFRCKKKSKLNQKRCLNLAIILLGFSFLHIMLHTVTGAIIDRYAIPALITNILGTILLFICLINYRKTSKKS